MFAKVDSPVPDLCSLLFQVFELFVDGWPVTISWILDICKSLRGRLIVGKCEGVNKGEEFTHENSEADQESVLDFEPRDSPCQLFCKGQNVGPRLHTFCHLRGHSVGMEWNYGREDAADILLPITSPVRDRLARELGDLSPDVRSVFCASG